MLTKIPCQAIYKDCMLASCGDCRIVYSLTLCWNIFGVFQRYFVALECKVLQASEVAREEICLRDYVCSSSYCLLGYVDLRYLCARTASFLSLINLTVLLRGLCLFSDCGVNGYECTFANDRLLQIYYSKGNNNAKFKTNMISNLRRKSKTN